jgi:hypothetical protein
LKFFSIINNFIASYIGLFRTTLKEIATSFRNKAVLLTEKDIAAEEAVIEEKARVVQVEVC